MTNCFYKTTDLNGSSYVKVPLRSSAILNIEIGDKIQFPWSILAHLHTPKIRHPYRISKYRQNFEE